MSSPSAVPTIRISDASPVVMSLGQFVTILAVIIGTLVPTSAFFYARLTNIEKTQERQGAEITALQTDTRSTREAIARIDQSLKNIDDYVKEQRQIQARMARVP